MITGKWLQPRHASEEVFERDFPQGELTGLDVYCPGCKGYTKLSRKNPMGRIAGWCKKCSRGVCP
ncbi:MAG: hypothetical protein AAB320_07575 [Elusimicrobiota bacterium]